MAQVLAGLNVPLSIDGGRMLGAARDPFIALRGELNMFGYQTAEEVEVEMRKRLTELDIPIE